MIAAASIPASETLGGGEGFDIDGIRWRDAQLAAAFFAVDPAGLGGVRIRALPGHARDRWADYLRSVLPEEAPLQKLPLGADTDRILGGLDFAATLRAGSPVCAKGVLAHADGGAVIVSMAERLAPSTAALIAAAMDNGFVAVERGGVSRRDKTQFGCVLFDEGLDPSEAPPDLLLERLAFHIGLEGVSVKGEAALSTAGADIEHARHHLAAVTCPVDTEEAIASAGDSLGVSSLRALSFAFRTARVSAALNRRPSVSQEDAEIACRLVFGPRAAPAMVPPESPPPDRRDSNDDASSPSREDGAEKDMQDMLVAAARAAALGWFLDKPSRSLRRRGTAGAGGKSGALVESTWKGRPAGARRGVPRDGARLDLLATLRNAAPWRRIRAADDRPARLPIYKDDIRIKRFKARSETVVIFVVDASGSSAMHRMAEAKGAVELLLTDCYSRRDHVALISFRGENADLLLPPTRSLTRVRRTLGALPGGGGTPLAAGLASAAALADSERRKGKTPFVVILSDGRGNIALSGEADRNAAEADAVSAGKRLRETGCAVLFFDTGNRPSPRARTLSDEIGARYSPLPYADSAVVSNSVKQAIAAAG